MYSRPFLFVVASMLLWGTHDHVQEYMLDARGWRYASLVIYRSGLSGVALICNTGGYVALYFLLLHVLFILGIIEPLSHSLLLRFIC